MSSRRSASTLPSNSKIGPCGLSDCPLSPCTLSTHHAYTSQFQVQSLSLRARRKGHETQEDRKLSPPMPLSDVVDRSLKYIESHISDGLPTLPLRTQFTREFRELIDHYVKHTVHRVSRIFSPHLDPQTRAREVIQQIYLNPIVCMVVVANVQTERLMLLSSSASSTTTKHDTGEVVPDRSTEIVYAVTLRVLQEQLTKFQPTDIDWILMLVVALAGLEFGFRFFDGAGCGERDARLRSHRDAIAKLVSMNGGIHTLNKALSYVLNTDRFLALCLGEYPLFQGSFPTVRAAELGPSRSLGVYGWALRGLTFTLEYQEEEQILDPAIIDFSEDQCRLIHLLETTSIDLTSSSSSSSTDHPPPLSATDLNILPYFMYLRDKIGNDHANLHAYYYENNQQQQHSPPRKQDSSSLSPAVSATAATKKNTNISRCVMLAGHIVFYHVGFGDYYTVLRPMLATELKGVLEEQQWWQTKRGGGDADHSTKSLDQSNEDESLRDVVIWLLFVLATVPAWDGHDWAIAELGSWLKWKYDNKDEEGKEDNLWADGSWVDEEHFSLTGFVWSNRTYDELYCLICEEVMILMNNTVENSPIKKTPEPGNDDHDDDDAFKQEST